MSLTVYFEGRAIGDVETGDDGLSFAYRTEWVEAPGAFPISVTMPLNNGPFLPATIEPWLTNLLAEGEQLRTMGRTLGIAPEDLLGFLQAVGRDTAGALSFGEPDLVGEPEYRVIESDADLERIINELPLKPFLAGEEGVSMSLAGVQDKLPVAILNGRLAIPVNGAPSTHILKPDSEKLSGLVQNEAFCLILARQMSLDAAEVTTGVAGDRQFLLVTRYDRRAQDEQIPWIRMHQEDFCQALGFPPARKYQHSATFGPGPGTTDLFSVTHTRSTVPAVDLNKLLDALIFNVLVGNTDAHAKNYSLIIKYGGNAELAPMYDVACAGPYSDVTRNLAQDIDDQNRGHHIHGRHWRRMAEAAGLNATSTVNRVKTLARLALEIVDDGEVHKQVTTSPAGDHWILNQVTEFITNRCRTVLLNLDD